MKTINLKILLAFAGFWCIGVSYAQYNQPGARDSHSGWTDASGNFWIFGGENCYGAFNDLWKYDLRTGHWTWVCGSNRYDVAGVYGTKSMGSSVNYPGARYGHSGWADGAGNFWIFGGADNNSTNYYNDLWKYTPGSGQWTWVGGSEIPNTAGCYDARGVFNDTNGPGARYYTAVAVDAAGNFWLFGGQDQTRNDYNDLWEFSPATGQWAWISGDTTSNNTGVYGKMGTIAPANKPGARSGHRLWIDATGNIWVYGGVGYATSGTAGAIFLDDLWKYDPAANQWTWMGGDNNGNNSGSYGTQGIAATTNKPGGRYAFDGMVDGAGNFWVFGGEGYDAGGNIGVLNDLWMYAPGTGQWTWMSGDKVVNEAALRGAGGVAATNNKPRGRMYSAGWVDGSGNIRFMGGEDAETNDHNDLWECAGRMTDPYRSTSNP